MEIDRGNPDLEYIPTKPLHARNSHRHWRIKLMKGRSGETGGGLILHFQGNGIVYHHWLNILTSWFCSAGGSSVVENFRVLEVIRRQSRGVCVCLHVCASVPRTKNRKCFECKAVILRQYWRASRPLTDRHKHHSLSLFFSRICFLQHHDAVSKILISIFSWNLVDSLIFSQGTSEQTLATL